MAINPALLAPGVMAPTWTTNLVRPAGRPYALWAGANNPGAGWTGVGAGWWVPPKSSIGTAASTTRPATTTTPAQTPGTSGTTTTAPATPPRAAPSFDPNTLYADPIYQANVGASQQKTNSTIAGYNKQGTDLLAALGDPNNPANSAAGTTLGGLEHQRPLDILAAQIAANRRGGIDSSSLAQQMGNIATDYAGKETTAIGNYNSAIGNLATLIAGAQQTEGTYEGGQLEDAWTRAVNAAAADTTLGAGAGNTTTTPATTPAGRMAPATIATHQGGSFYNWYVNTYGTKPPAMVSPNSARYVAWQRGTPAAQARQIQYGTVAG